MSIFNFSREKKKTDKKLEEPEILVMEKEPLPPKVDTSVKNVTEYYTCKFNAFLSSFDDNQQVFEERARIKLMEIECALNEEYYVEKTTHIGGIVCTIRDDEAIKLHYNNLQKEYESLQKRFKKKRNFAAQKYKQFMEEAEEALRLEQVLASQELWYETILPTRLLKTLIHPLPMYVFKNLDAEGNFSLHIDDYYQGSNLIKRLQDPEHYLHAEAKRICFGKQHLVTGRNPARREYDIEGRISFPEADRATQDKILAFHQKGYSPYTIVHENAFGVNVRSHNLPEEDPISVADKGKMSILIVQFGDFDMEKAVIEEAKKWFDKVHEKCFSLN